MDYEQLLQMLKRDLPGQVVDATPSLWNSVYFQWALFIGSGVLAVILIGWVLSAIAEVYGVWAARKEGQAALARANNEQQIQVAEAQGRLNAAEINKKAAIVEAEAVAAQIEKIGANLKEHDLYLKWQWIQMMEHNENSDVIYVPTECGLPVLEAGKRHGS